jgi:hypothetical protein
MAVRTKVDQELAEQAEAHADDPERASVIEHARRFKSSWLELAEALTRVRAAGRFRDWGYASLDDYAKKELHLRPDTVEKLTGSFAFLKKRAPEVLDRDGITAPIPSYQAVSFLSHAEAAPDVKRDVVDEIRKRVLEENAPAGAVARQYKNVVFPISPSEKRDQDAAGLRNVGKRLFELLQETRAVPKKLATEVAESVEKLLEALGDKDERAA